MSQDYKIAYTRQIGSDTSFYNSRGQLIWNTLGECIAYTQNSCTMMSCGKKTVYKFDENGRPNIILSENNNFFGG